MPSTYVSLDRPTTGGGRTPDEAAAYIKELKDAERYVLEEVYTCTESAKGLVLVFQLLPLS